MMLWPEFTHGIPDLPRGGVDEGETLEQVAQREWFEETGLPFDPTGGVMNRYSHVRGFYAEDNGEFLVYEQTFFLYPFERKQPLGEKWRNPEGDLAGWVALNQLSDIC